MKMNLRIVRIAAVVVITSIVATIADGAYTWSNVAPAVANPPTRVTQPVAYSALCAPGLNDPPLMSNGYIVIAPNGSMHVATDQPDPGYPKLIGNDLAFLGDISWNQPLPVGSTGSITFVATTMSGQTQTYVTPFRIQ